MKVLFFSPHSAIWAHAFPEALIAEALAQAGHEIVYVGCGEQFKAHCVSMSAQGVKVDSSGEEKQAVCNSCKRNETLIREKFRFGGYSLFDVLDKVDHAEIERHMQAASVENFLQIVLDGVEVGRAALGTFLLTYKRNRLDFDKKTWQVFAVELRNTLYSFYGARKILGRERPDRLVVYSSGYSVNLVFCRVAEKLGITHYYMNAGSNITDRLQKLVLARGHSVQKRLLGYWPAFRERPCSPAVMRYTTDHFLEVLRGRSAFVYSAGRSGDGVDVRRYFGVASDQRILLATLSSLDEMFAAEVTGLFPSDYKTPFRDQLSWLSALIPWVAARPDLFLIIRVHPREFPNKRDDVKSEHASRLEVVLTNLPANVAINWPKDGLSLYDLAEVVAVCLNAWSTVGKEMALLGIPTVIYSPDLVFYPEDLNYFGTSQEGYFSAIQQALVEGWNGEWSRKAYRWLALEDFYSRLDISDGFKRSEYQVPGLLGRVFSRARRKIEPKWKERHDCERRPEHLRIAAVVNQIVSSQASSVVDILGTSAVPDVTLAEETISLKVELGRLCNVLYTDFRVPGSAGTLKRNLQGFLAMR